MKTVTFKRAGIQDADNLQKLALETFSTAFAHLNKEENMKAYMDAAFSTTQLEAELSDDRSQFFFAVADGENVGYLKLNFGGAQTDIQDPEALEIQRIYVHPQHQNAKIGEAMLQKAIAIARNHKLKYIWLCVWESNPRAITFYERNGFRKVGEHPFQFGDDRQTDFIMKLEVS